MQIPSALLLAQFGPDLGVYRRSELPPEFEAIQSNSCSNIFWRAHWHANSFANGINQAHPGLLTGPWRHGRNSACKGAFARAVITLPFFLRACLPAHG